MYTKLISTELEALQERCIEMQAEYEHSSRIYGNGFTNIQDRFLLLPLRVTLCNEKDVWLYPFLYLFSNHMAVLKFVESFSNIAEIEEFYKNRIINDEIAFIATDDEFRHIILTDFDEMPSRIDSLTSIMQEDIFRIVSAPAPNIPSSIRKDAEELLKNYSYGKHNIRFVLKSTGGCFSFVDKELLEYCSQLYLQESLISLDEVKRQYLSCKVVRNVELNVEYAILIIMLKKMKF